MATLGRGRRRINAMIRTVGVWLLCALVAALLWVLAGMAGTMAACAG